MGVKRITTSEELVKWIHDNKDRERNRNKPVFAEWVNVIAAFHNRPDLQVNEDFRMLNRLTPEQRKDLEGIAVNWVQPHIRTAAAHLQKSRPALSVVPATTDDADVQAAKIGDRFIKAEWESQSMPIKRIEKSIWMIAVGTGIWHIYFDPSQGPMNQGMPIGQIVTETVNPFKIVFEPNRTDYTKCRWAILTQRLPVDEIEEKFGDSYSQLNNGMPLTISGDTHSQKTSVHGNTDVFDIFETNYSAMMGIDRTTTDDGEWADVDTLYYMPTKQYPEGIYAIVCEGKVLYTGPYPYPFLDHLPFCIFREIPSPWRFYGEGSASHVMRAQENYVYLRKMERRIIRNFANPKWLLPKGLRVNKDKLIDEKERFVSYDAKSGQHPEFVNGANPPQALNNAMERAKDEGTRASGINEATLGVAPQGITAGRALLALQEQDETRLGITVELNEREYARWGQIVLQLAKHFYKEERKYHIAGDAMAGLLNNFNIADLNSCEDVICQPGSAMPQNRMAKQETAIQFYQLGILGNPQDSETMVRLRKILEFGQIEDIHDDDGLDEQKATAENQQIAQIAMNLEQMLSLQGLSIEMLPPEQLMQMGIPAAQPLENQFVHMRNHVREWKNKSILGQNALCKLLEAHLQTHYLILNPPQQQPQLETPQDSQQPQNEEQAQPGPSPEEQIEASQPQPNPQDGSSDGMTALEQQGAITSPELYRNDLSLSQADMEDSLKTNMEH